MALFPAGSVSVMDRLRTRSASIKKRFAALPPGVLNPSMADQRAKTVAVISTPKPGTAPDDPKKKALIGMPVLPPTSPRPIGGPIGPYIPAQPRPFLPSTLSPAEQQTKLNTLAYQEAFRSPSTKSTFKRDVGMVTGTPQPIRRVRRPLLPRPTGIVQF